MNAIEDTRQRDATARRVAIQHEAAEHAARAHVLLGRTLDGPIRLAALLADIADLGEAVAVQPLTTPREKVLDVLGHCQAWLEEHDRQAAL